MSNPSTDWREKVGPDEEERHRTFTEAVVALQARIDRKHGRGRAFHRKAVAGATGYLTVAEGLSEHQRHGLFAQPRTFPVIIRMSNGFIIPQNDLTPDVRGIALSVRDVKGPGALGRETDRQDFLLINRPAFGFTDSVDFAALVLAGTSGQTALAKHLISRYGTIQGPLELARVGRDYIRPFTGFATTTFFSAAPIRFGPYAAHLRLVPDGAVPNPLALQDLHHDIALRLRRRPLRYELRAQFFVSEDVTPIEDGRKPWPESKSPVGTIAHLDLPVQELDSDEGVALAAAVEEDHFDPWSALEEHRPLGEIMRARKAAYYPSYVHRRQPV